MISIVIPAYNAESTLGACLESLILQTYRDIEILVVDDGSQDGTAQLAAGYAARDGRIRLLRQENAGVSAARNAGIDASHGELIGFVDSDDTVCPEFLEELIGLYEPGILPVAGIRRSDGMTAPLPPAPVRQPDPVRAADEFIGGALGQSIAFAVWNKLFAAELLRREAIRFPVGIPIGEDALFTLRYLRRCREIRCAPRAVYRYNVAQGSAVLAKRDSVRAYEALLAAFRQPDGDFPPVGEDALSVWALESCAYILVNPFVTEKSYAGFSDWLTSFRNTAVFAAAVRPSSRPVSRKRHILRRLMRSRSPLPLFLLLRFFRKTGTRRGAGHKEVSHD